jgi:outer membrane protein W
MRRLLFVLLFAATPLFAQDMQITAWASRSSIDGDELTDGFETDFEDGDGIGVSVNRYFGRMFSVEGSAFLLRNDAQLIVGGLPVDVGSVDLKPISLGAQFHPFRGRIDPYVGAGGTYVLTGDLFSAELEAVGRGRVEIDSGVTYYANAGLGVQITDGFAIVADARYIPFETDSESTVTGGEEEIDLTSTVYSLGLRFRF